MLYTDALAFYHLHVTMWEYLTALWGGVSWIWNIWALFSAPSLTNFMTSFFRKGLDCMIVVFWQILRIN